MLVVLTIMGIFGNCQDSIADVFDITDYDVSYYIDPNDDTDTVLDVFGIESELIDVDSLEFIDQYVLSVQIEDTRWYGDSFEEYEDGILVYHGHSLFITDIIRVMFARCPSEFERLEYHIIGLHFYVSMTSEGPYLENVDGTGQGMQFENLDELALEIVDIVHSYLDQE